MQVPGWPWHGRQTYQVWFVVCNVGKTMSQTTHDWGNHTTYLRWWLGHCLSLFYPHCW
jgi:hypothetical protein